jgi:hypothetical protein
LSISDQSNSAEVFLISSSQAPTTSTSIPTPKTTSIAVTSSRALTDLNFENTWIDLYKIFSDNSIKLLFSFVKGKISNIYSVRLSHVNDTLHIGTPAMIGQVILSFKKIFNYILSNDFIQ